MGPRDFRSVKYCDQGEMITIVSVWSDGQGEGKTRLKVTGSIPKIHEMRKEKHEAINTTKNNEEKARSYKYDFVEVLV